jgi:hypothetical protein
VDESRELLPVDGALRRLPPSLLLRLLQALTLWLLIRGLALTLARFSLALRFRGSLKLRGDDLVLDREMTIWGRCVKKSTSVLPRAGLAEMTLETGGESLSFLAGLGSLCVGTFLGTRLISEGVFSGATSLLLTGSGLVLLGVALDFFLGSGRREPSLRGPTQLVIRATGERGWVLSQVDPQAAQVLLGQVQALGSSPPLSHPGQPEAVTPEALASP